jgi:pyruvate kinase
MSLSQTKVTASGPELRGANITLEKVMAKTETDLRQSKIICTLGPACWEVPQLEELVDVGLAVARFNFSHGDHEGHKACLDRMRQAASNKGKHVGTYHTCNDIIVVVANIPIVVVVSDIFLARVSCPNLL